MNEMKSYVLEEWWTDSQIELVKDLSRIWVKKRFEKVPGVWIFENGQRILAKLSQHEELREGGVIDFTAWDHEHCELCWDKISENINDNQEGYTDENEWLCLECYNKYIAPLRIGQ